MANELATSKETTNYLMHVYEMEKSLYEQKRIMDQLEKSIRTINGQMQLKPEMAYEQESSMSDSIVKAIICAISAVLIYCAYLFLKSPEGGAPDWFLFGMQVVIGILSCGALVTIYMGYINVNNTNQYNKEVRAANNKYMEEYQTWQHRLQKKKGVLSNEYNMLNKERQNTKEVLEKFYSINVIFPKYRNLPAISSIFEYMLSERCYELTGHEGAYNLYENELRLGHIISTLDSIQSDINEIKHNQRMLYEVVVQSKNVTEKLLKQEIINGQILYDIRQDAEIIQYNQAQIAKRVEHIHWLEENKVLFG